MRFEDSLPQIKRFAWRVKGQALKRGASSMQIEDIMQELAIAWMKSRDRYKADAGASFSTFLEKGMALHMRGFLRDKLEREHGSDRLTVSIDAPAGEDGSFHELLPSVAPAADAGLHERDLFKEILRGVTKRARIYLKLLVDTPPELLTEIQKVDTRQAYARSRGIKAPAVKTVPSSIIFDLMGAKPAERAAILKEVRFATDQLCAA